MAEKEENNDMTADKTTPDDLIRGHDSHVDPLKEQFFKMGLNQDDNIEPSEAVEQAKEDGTAATVLNVPGNCYSRQNTQELVTSLSPVNIPATTASIFLDVKNSSINVAQKAKKENTLKIRFSTVLCTGLPNTGKSSFCELLADKATAISTSPHRVVIKKGTAPKDTIEVSEDQLDELNDKLIRYKNSPQQPEPLNPKETLEILLLFDKNVPTPALSLLQPSIVTFVTYKMRGEHFRLSKPSQFFEIEKEYSTFVKELLSSSSVAKPSAAEFPEVELSDEEVDCKEIYNIAFVGIFKGSSSEELNNTEVEVVNESLSILKKNINCCFEETPLLFWPVKKDKNDEGKQFWLHLVNLANHEDKDFCHIKNHLEQIISENSTYHLPLSWVLLYIKIQKLSIESKVSFLQFSKVVELWTTECMKSEVTELKCALNFFQHVGALFYFDSVKDVSDFVFTDLCWLFSKLDCFYNYRNIKCDYTDKVVLEREGKLLSRVVRRSKYNEPEKLGLKHLVYVLEHLKFIAPLEPKDYFFPSFLASYQDKSKVFDHYGNSQFPPLLITFSSGSSYRSVFCFLAAHIMKNLPEGWSKPKYYEDEGHQYTFRDLVTFCVGVHHYICIIDKTFFLEIQIYSHYVGSLPGCLHHSVYKFIKQSLEVVCKCLQLPDDYTFGFSCVKCNNESKLHAHLMIIKNHHDEKICDQAYCIKTNTPQSLTDDHKVWFSEKSTHVQETEDLDCNTMSIGGTSNFITSRQEATKHNSGDALAIGNTDHPSNFQATFLENSKPTKKKLLNHVVNDVTTCWYDLGVMLLKEDQESRLDVIKDNHNGDNKKCCRDMLWYWLSANTDASWKQLIEALRSDAVHHPVVATKIEKVLSDEYPKQDPTSAPVGHQDNHPLDANGRPIHSIPVSEGVKELFIMEAPRKPC